MPSAALTGNWRALRGFAKKLDYVASTRFSSGFANALADTLLNLVDEGFKSASDPDGHPWKPKVIEDGRAPLHGATGELSQKRNWLKKQVDSRRIRIGPKPGIAARAAFAQFGTGIYGRSGKRIVAKAGRALSWATNGGRFAFRSVTGSPIRRILPSEGRLPYRWHRALTHAKDAFLFENLRKAG